MKRHAVYALFFSCTLFGAAEFVPIQEKAQGQSLAGSALGNDSVFSNPASSAFSQLYSLSGDFLPPKSFSVSVVDTRTSSLSGGLGYFRNAVPGHTKPLQGVRLTLSSRVNERIAIGLGAKTVWGPSGTTSNDRMNDADLGILANFGTLQVGGVLRNVLGGNDPMRFDRELAIGGRINYRQILFLSMATVTNTSSMTPQQYGVGAEYVSPYYLAAKGGYRTLPHASESYWSLGASFLSPMLSLHYAFEKATFGQGASDHQLSVSMLF